MFRSNLIARLCCLQLNLMVVLTVGCPAVPPDGDDPCNTERACRCEDGRSGTRVCKTDPVDHTECVCDTTSSSRRPKVAAAKREADGAAKDAAAPSVETGPRDPDAGAGERDERNERNERDTPPPDDGQGGSPSGESDPPNAGNGTDTGGTGADAGTGAEAGDGGDDASAIGSELPAPADLLAEPTDEAVYVFDQTQLRTYDVRIAPADLAMIDQQPAAEMWVPASVVFEGKTYGPLMMRYKGSNAAFGEPCTSGGINGPKAERCSFKIGFDEVDTEARFYGLRKLNFHAMNLDHSLMRERLGYGLFRAHGVAAPRAAHARVLINGQLDGLYVVVEQIDGRFTRARFTDGGEGNLYKEVWPVHDDPQEYLNKLETNEDEAPSVQVMLDLKASIARSSAAVAAIVGQAYTLRYIAVDRVIMNDDGLFHFYCSPGSTNLPANHNYYWYEGLAGDRLWLIPWDLDNSFDTYAWAHVSPEWNATAACQCNAVADAYQAPPTCDPLVERFASWTPEYEAEVDRFLAGPFAQAAVNAKLRAWSEQIRPVVIEVNGLHAAPTEAQWAEALMDFEAKLSSARVNRGYPY